jgi:metal-dependent amidase/aminoacylase/carboxypeptidase family protein
VTAEVSYTREFVPLINDAFASEEALAAAQIVIDPENVKVAEEPVTASEDFARFLDHVPGCFVNIGNGGSAPLHNPTYDFNDAALPYGAPFHVAIVRRRLPAA